MKTDSLIVAIHLFLKLFTMNALIMSNFKLALWETTTHAATLLCPPEQPTSTGQECIPVGCVPFAAVAAATVCVSQHAMGRGCHAQHALGRGVSAWGVKMSAQTSAGVLPGGMLAQACWDTHTL